MLNWKNIICKSKYYVDTSEVEGDILFTVEILIALAVA